MHPQLAIAHAHTQQQDEQTMTSCWMRQPQSPAQHAQMWRMWVDVVAQQISSCMTSTSLGNEVMHKMPKIPQFDFQSFCSWQFHSKVLIVDVLLCERFMSLMLFRMIDQLNELIKIEILHSQ
jgi:hypothetical protein